MESFSREETEGMSTFPSILFLKYLKQTWNILSWDNKGIYKIPSFSDKVEEFLMHHLLICKAVHFTQVEKKEEEIWS